MQRVENRKAMAPCPCRLQTLVHQQTFDAGLRQFPARIQRRCLGQLQFLCHSFQFSWSFPYRHRPCRPPVAGFVHYAPASKRNPYRSAETTQSKETGDTRRPSAAALPEAMDYRTHQRLARQLPALGRPLRPLAHDLWRFLSYRLLHDCLAESCAIACSQIEDGGAPGGNRTPDPLLRSRVTTLVNACRSERKAEEYQH
jgi:hypothetical protein